jgi:hypothetical protein
MVSISLVKKQSLAKCNFLFLNDDVKITRFIIFFTSFTSVLLLTGYKTIFT